MAQAAEQGTAVGTSIPRVDGVAKVTGRALYIDDIATEGALHGATVRSAVPHGVLRGLRRDPAFDWSDIVVVTAEQIPGRNFIALIEDDQPALVPIGGRVRHCDEAVALVAAPTRRRAQAAAAALHVDIDPLPAVFTIDGALAADIALHGDDNIFKRFEIRKGSADIDAAIAACPVVIDGTYDTSAQEQMYIEPQGVIADWRGDACYITGSMQCPYYVHKAMKELLGLPGEQVIIGQSVTGGGFGGKEEYPSMIAGHAALLARVAGRPVRLIYDREEDIRATTKRHPARIHHRLGLDHDGTVRAMDIDVVIDGGAYATLSAVVLSRAVLHAAGPYRCPDVRIVGRAVATNTPPHGAFRGFGAPQTTFAYERQMQKAGRQLGLEPFALRRHNLLRSGDATATSQELTHSVGSDDVLDAVWAIAGEAPARDAVGPSGAPLKRGRGLAFYFHGAGFTGSGEQRLAGRATLVFRDGAFHVLSSSTDIGQGAITIFAQIAASALGVSAGDIVVTEPSTDQVPDSGPTVASRTCMVVGGVLERAARELRARIEAWAAAHDRAGASLLEIAAAMVAAGETVATTAQYEPPPGIVWDDATYTGSAYPVYGWGCCLVDVSVDLDTYEVTVDRCVQAIDVGKAIHPIIVKGQIEGGTLQALGWALLEDVVYRDGRVANPNMTNYIVPTFADAPEMQTILVEKPYPFGPHGAKGVGEIPMDGPAAAVAGAVEDALGVAFDRIPILPERVEAALRGEAS
ncbi:MAG TPA: xanthine dehydrogenase family protein molybdopterin-binding subunit [Kofleriaceae bacterium]|nr:xanthine dehydrogenase family protein molybdopterin-binding subunit [Kofleriaceae bacterium]